MNIPEARLASAFVKGAMLEAWVSYYTESGESRRTGGLWSLDPVVLGRVLISSGRVVAGDVPMCFEMTAPFLRRVPPGEYEAVATIARPHGRSPADRPESGTGTMGYDPRVAYLGLLIADEKPVTFEYAVMERLYPNGRQNDEFEGFGVDVGPAGIMDAASLVQFSGELEDDDLSGTFYEELKARPETLGKAALVTLPWSPPVRLACADSGWGDGEYRSYWGLNSAGDPVQLIVDFDLPGSG